MKIEIVESKTMPSRKFWSGAPETSFVAFYDGVVSSAVIFLPGMVILKSTSAWNREQLVEKKSLHTTFNPRSAAKILPGIVQHSKPQPLRQVQLQGFKTMENLCNEEFMSMAHTLVLDYKDFLEDQLSSLLNLTLLKCEHSLSTAYNQAMVATMGPSDVESLLRLPPNPRYLAGYKNGNPFVAFYDGTATTAVIFLPGAVRQINALATSSRKKVGPFVAFYDGMAASAQIFLPGAVEHAYALIRSNGIKAGLLRQSYVACYERRAASAHALDPVNAQLKLRPLRHVPRVGFKSMESASMTNKEEFLSMVCTLVLDYKDFLEDQLSSLLNLALLKCEHSLSTSYNQAMVATMGPSDVESLLRLPPNPRYLAGHKNGNPFVAFYDGTAATAVIFLPGAVRQINALATSSRKKIGPFVAFYDGMAASAQIFLPGAIEQAYALIPSNGIKAGLLRQSYVASARALVPVNARMKPRLLRHVPLVGFKSMESASMSYNEVFLSMARTLVPDYKDFLEDQLVRLLNLAILKREQSLATMGQRDVSSPVSPSSNPWYLSEPNKAISFVAFYNGTANTAVIFLPAAAEKMNGLTTSSKKTKRPFAGYYGEMEATGQISSPGAVGQANVVTTSNRIKTELLTRSFVDLSEVWPASAHALMPINDQHLKPQPLRHVQLQGFKKEFISLSNEEFLSMVRTLVLDYKDFLEDQLSSLLNLALLKCEHSLSTAYNQAMVATMGPSDVESLLRLPPNPRYLAGHKNGNPFVAFYDGTATTAVIFLPGAVQQTNALATSSRKKVGPYIAFYDGMAASAQIFLPGAIEQAYALIPNTGIKAGLLRQSYVACYERRAASAHALEPVNAQLKLRPLRHVPLVGFKSMESASMTHSEEFLSMVCTLVLDYKDFLEDRLSSLLNLALLMREHSLSTAFNQEMAATVGPVEVESLVRPAPNSRYLARLPFIAFHEGVVAASVEFLPPGHLTIPVSRLSSPRKSTRMEIKPNQDIVHNDGILATAQIFLPFLVKQRQSDVHSINPRLLFRPLWSRDEKCRLLKDKLDGLPLRYRPRTTKYITFEEKDIDTRQRILNTIPSMKTVSPGSCLARSSLTPCYFLQETYPDMVSATLKDLAAQHIKYFRASPSRAPGRRAGRTQIQIMEDLYWEKLRKMSAPETADEIASRRQQEMCFNKKLWYGSVIKKTNHKSDHETKSVLNTRTRTTAQLNDTACLNTNNNGYTKEEDDCDRDTADSCVFGSKSDQGFSRGQDLARRKPRHSYLNKRHSDGYRSRNKGSAGMDGACADFHKTHIEPEDTGKDTGQFKDSPSLLQCQRKGAILTQRELEKVFNPTVHGLGGIFGSFAPHELSSQEYDDEALFEKGTPEDDAIHLKELLKDVSNFDSISDVPESTLLRVALLTCKPFLNGGYNSGLGFLSKLKQSPECSPVLPIQNLEHCAGPCVSTGSAAVSPTGSSTENEEVNIVQKQRDVLYREACCMRVEQFPLFEAKSTNDDDFIGDLSFTDNSPDGRTEFPRSFLHDDFIHEDDVLDIPTLSILSPSRASLGQAYPSGHFITSLSTLDHDEDKPASHEPFPSEYVFKRACGPSFRVSSEYWHIQIPTLPSDMVDYKVETDGLTEIVIGSGCFGKVYAATLTVSPGQSRDVVVKEHFTDKTTQESIASEAKITMYLESTGCVPICYGLLSDEEDGYNIVMEYVGSGQTLYDVMRELELPRLHWLNIACQLVSGLNKIHKKDVLINDIKSDNILVDLSGELPVVKFCDMGTASYKSGVTYRGDMKNCVHLAPEACAHLETTTACDVFSLGRVLKKIHGVSHISILLVVSDMCMAEDPANRPTLEAANQLLQGEYTSELMFPTLTVPSHLDSIDEESQEESAGSILRPVNEDQPTAVGLGTAEINGDVSCGSSSVDCSPRGSRTGKVSPSHDQALVTTISKYDLGPSLAAADPAEIQDIPPISTDHVPHIHVAGSSHRNAVSSVNMTKCALSSAEVTDISAVASKSAQKQTETLFNNMEAAASKSAQSGRTSMANIVDAATTRSAEHGNGSLDTMTPNGISDIPAAFSSPDGSYRFYPPSVPPSSPASSCASCHLHATSSSMELSLAANSPNFPVTMETLDTASELQASPSHTHDASSDMFVDAVEDLLDSDADSEGRHSDADINEAAAVDVDGNLTSPSLEAARVAEYRAICQAELEVYNKYCEDTSVYEDYLPLVLPLLMLPLGFFGLI